MSRYRNGEVRSHLKLFRLENLALSAGQSLHYSCCSVDIDLCHVTRSAIPEVKVCIDGRGFCHHSTIWSLAHQCLSNETKY